MSKNGETPKLFLSYRRGDLSGHASAMVGRIHDRLQSHFGRDHVFMDVDSIPPGVNFVEHLNEAVAKADVLLAVVGPNWVELLNERAGDPDDFVKIEVKAALDRSIPVIPLLVGAAKMPSRSELPAELGSFTLRNAVGIDSGRDFNSHTTRLIEDIEKLVGPARPNQPVELRPAKKKRVFKMFCYTAIAIALAFGAMFLLNDDDLPDDDPPVVQGIARDRTYSLAGLKYKVDVNATFDGDHISGTISAQEHGEPGQGFGFSGTRSGDILNVKINNNDEWWHGLELANPQADDSYNWELENNDTVLKFYVSSREGTFEWELVEK